MTYLTQAARHLAARTGDTIGDAEASIVLVCERLGCDVQEAAARLVELFAEDTEDTP